MIRPLKPSTLASLTLLGLVACRGQDAAAPPATSEQATAEPAQNAQAARAAGDPPAAPADSLPPGHPPIPGSPGSGETAHGDTTHGSAATPPTVQAGGLTWAHEAPLVREQPTTAMRAAQYRVPGEAGQQDAELTVFYFGAGQGGSVDDNLQRWVGQFQQPDGRSSQEAARIDRRTLGSGVEITTVDVRGTYTGMAVPGMPAAPPQTDYRALGAIAAGPQGPVFFKLVGPHATVERAAAAFAGLVDSIKPTT